MSFRKRLGDYLLFGWIWRMFFGSSDRDCHCNDVCNYHDTDYGIKDDIIGRHSYNDFGSYDVCDDHLDYYDNHLNDDFDVFDDDW